MANNKGVEEFIKQADIFHQLGLENIPEEQKNNLMNLMVDTVINRFTTQIIDRFNSQQRSEFDQLVEEGDETKIMDYLKKNVPDYEAMLFNEVENLKLELIKASPILDREIKEVLKERETKE